MDPRLIILAGTFALFVVSLIVLVISIGRARKAPRPPLYTHVESQWPMLMPAPAEREARERDLFAEPAGGIAPALSAPLRTGEWRPDAGTSAPKAPPKPKTAPPRPATEAAGEEQDRQRLTALVEELSGGAAVMLGDAGRGAPRTPGIVGEVAVAQERPPVIETLPRVEPPIKAATPRSERTPDPHVGPAPAPEDEPVVEAPKRVAPPAPAPAPEPARAAASPVEPPAPPPAPASVRAAASPAEPPPPPVLEPVHKSTTASATPSIPGKPTAPVAPTFVPSGEPAAAVAPVAPVLETAATDVTFVPISEWEPPADLPVAPVAESSTSTPERPKTVVRAEPPPPAPGSATGRERPVVSVPAARTVPAPAAVAAVAAAPKPEPGVALGGVAPVPGPEIRDTSSAPPVAPTSPVDEPSGKRGRAIQASEGEVEEHVLVAPIEMWFGEARIGVKKGTRTYDLFQKYATVLFEDYKRAKHG